MFFYTYFVGAPDHTPPLMRMSITPPYIVMHPDINTRPSTGTADVR